MRTFGLLYPMFDLMQLTILVAVAGPGRPMWRPLTVIGAGLAIRAVADAVYVSLVARGDYTPGHPVDVCWPLSYLLIGLATRYPPPSGRATATDDRSSRRCRRGGGWRCRTCRWAGRSSRWCWPGGPAGRPRSWSSSA